MASGTSKQYLLNREERLMCNGIPFQNVNTDPENKPIKCPQCHLRLRDESTLTIHIYRNHPGMLHEVTCPIPTCNMVIKNVPDVNKALDVHFQECHSKDQDIEEDGENYKLFMPCPLCSEIFETKVEQTNHLIASHIKFLFLMDPRTKANTCLLCNDVMGGMDEQLRHIKERHGCMVKRPNGFSYTPGGAVKLCATTVSSQAPSEPFSSSFEEDMKRRKKKLLQKRGIADRPAYYKLCPHSGCSEVFRFSNDYEDHVKNRHKVDVEYIQCPLPTCRELIDVDTTVSEAIDNHFLQSHKDQVDIKKESYAAAGSSRDMSLCDEPCPLCSRVFMYKEEVLEHIKNDHGTMMTTVEPDMLTEKGARRKGKNKKVEEENEEELIFIERFEENEKDDDVQVTQHSKGKGRNVKRSAPVPPEIEEIEELPEEESPPINQEKASSLDRSSKKFLIKGYAKTKGMSSEVSALFHDLIAKQESSEEEEEEEPVPKRKRKALVQEGMEDADSTSRAKQAKAPERRSTRQSGDETDSPTKRLTRQTKK